MRQLPYQGTLWLITFLQLLSLYEVRPWLDLSFASAVVPFCFLCFALSAIIFSLFQGSSKGRAVTAAQRGLLLISGIILALQTILRYVGLRYTGPLQTILGEYAGAVIGSLFFKPLTKRIDQSGKSRVLFASGIVIYLLSQEWTAASCFPLPISAPRTSAFASGRAGKELRDGKACGSLFPVVAATLAGLLSSLSKSISAQVALRSMSKKRYFFLNYSAAALVLLPWTVLLVIFQGESVVGFSMAWPLTTTVALGMILAFFGDSFSVVSPSSTWHYFVSLCCLYILDLFFNMDFSPLGSLLCSFLLGLGVRELMHAAKGLANDGSAADNISSAIQPVAATLVTALKDVLADTKSRKIAMFLLINTSYMIVEFTYGFISNSLGLISDACHMLFDCAALAIGLYAAYISRLQANAKFNYGYGRFEVLSGYANAVFLVLVAALIVLESLERILDPPEISTESLLLVSVGGLVVNIIGLLFFHEAHHHAHGGSCAHSHAHEHITPSSILVETEVMKPGHNLKKLQQHQIRDGIVCCSKHDHHHDHLQVSEIQEGNNKVDHANTCCASEQAKDHAGTGVSCNGHQHKGATWDTDQHHCSGHLSPALQHGESIEQGHSHHICGSDKHIQEQHDHRLHSPGSPQELQEGYSQAEGIAKMPANDHQEHLHQIFHDKSSTKDDVFQEENVGWQIPEAALNGTQHHSEHHHDCKHHEHHNHDSRQPHGGMEHGISHSHMEQHIEVEPQEEHGHHHHHHDHHHNNGGHQRDTHQHHHEAQGDLNLEGIFLHVLADTLGSVGVVLSTLLLKYKGWVLADAACSIFISAMIIATVIPLLRSSSDILLLRIPRSAEKRIAKALEELKYLQGLHHCQRIHIWSLTNKETVGSLHAHAETGADKDVLHNQVSQLLLACGVTDITVQIEEVQAL